MKLYFTLIISLPWSIYFNFRYLPMCQAIKLPILLFKPKLISLKGKVVISAAQVRFGMIKLGKHCVSIYPDNGITFENNGGVIEFKGSCFIGSNSFISIGSKGKLVVGDEFRASSSYKLVCYHYINIKENVRFGWECMIMDTGFHPLKSIESGGFAGKAYGPIFIGKNNWFGNGSLIMKNTVTVEYCTFGARSILTKKYEVEPYSLLVGSPLRVVKIGVYRDMDDSTETYSSYIE
ncbi:LbetaH domain-containing protein [Pseudoalteromonas piratica]|uniref:Transferase n=1 Tax=Pseudoalteromonas piratica TaxID=1348114 RepID=A0A0A7EHF6_9GAMM|nr:hypothetical protein [Pseudoalteromonas piratica]AIY65427.1 hypothetical protein OM33_09910 [Pseudoalteromonas piratica]